MTKTQKIIGGSILSILLLTVTLFSMCGIRLQRLNTEDDAAFNASSDEQYQDDLLDKLEFVDDEENPANADVEGNSSITPTENVASTEPAPTSDAENFLTPNLMQKMQSEISDLQRLYQLKQKSADSLRRRAEEVKFRNVAMEGAKQSQNFVDQPLFVDKGMNRGQVKQTEATEFEMYYQDALDDFYTRRYKRAIQKFRKLLLRTDAGSLADNCQYWIGESYFALGNYYQAVAEFEKVYAWSNSNKISDAQLMVGISLLKAGDMRQARNEFDTLMSFFQNREAAQKARRYLQILERA